MFLLSTVPAQIERLFMFSLISSAFACLGRCAAGTFAALLCFGAVHPSNDDSHIISGNTVAMCSTIPLSCSETWVEMWHPVIAESQRAGLGQSLLRFGGPPQQ